MDYSAGSLGIGEFDRIGYALTQEPPSAHEGSQTTHLSLTHISSHTQRPALSPSSPTATGKSQTPHPPPACIVVSTANIVLIAHAWNETRFKLPYPVATANTRKQSKTAPAPNTAGSLLLLLPGMRAESPAVRTYLLGRWVPKKT